MSRANPNPPAPNPAPSAEEPCELTATVDGRAVRFEQLELWWTEPEPPELLMPAFSLVTCADAPADRPRIEIECPAPEATTFRDLRGATFRLSPLSADGGLGWFSLDVGRDWRGKGFAIREWVARGATVRFDDTTDDVLTGTIEADLERSAAKGGAVGGPTILITGRFRARAPRW